MNRTIFHLFYSKILFLSEILFRLRYGPLTCRINHNNSLIYRSLSHRYISLPQPHCGGVKIYNGEITIDLEISVKDGEKRWAKHGNDESRSA